MKDTHTHTYPQAIYAVSIYTHIIHVYFTQMFYFTNMLLSQTPLHIAVANGFTEVTEALLERGADVNAFEVCL